MAIQPRRLPFSLSSLFNLRSRRPSALTSPAPPRSLPTRAFRFCACLVSIYCSLELLHRFTLYHTFGVGPSMYPTLASSGVVQIWSRSVRNGKGLKIGDIIVISNPIFADQTAGKRVVGLPGDYVVRDLEMKPSVGGARVRGITDWKVEEERREPVMMQVPEGHVWVVGDNLGESRDSRFYGPVPLALVEGRMLAKGNGWFNWQWMGEDHLKSVEEVD